MQADPTLSFCPEPPVAPSVDDGAKEKARRALAALVRYGQDKGASFNSHAPDFYGASSDALLSIDPSIGSFPDQMTVYGQPSTASITATSTGSGTEFTIDVDLSTTTYSCNSVGRGGCADGTWS